MSRQLIDVRNTGIFLYSAPLSRFRCARIANQTQYLSNLSMLLWRVIYLFTTDSTTAAGGNAYVCKMCAARIH